MPRRLTLAQRLTDPDGVPTTLARVGVVVLMAVAAAIGWAAGPDRPSSPPAHEVVAIDRLSGDLPISSGDANPELGSAAALPRIQGGGGSRRAPAPAPELSPTPTATPAPTASPEPTPTPDVTVVPVGTAPPEPEPAPAPAPAPPKPRATPGPTFDSSG